MRRSSRRGASLRIASAGDADLLGDRRPRCPRRVGSRQRMTPAQTLEAREVAISGNDLASGFNGQRREERVGDRVPPRANFPAKPPEDVPVARARPYHDAVRLIE
jgi:hypothetical protein